MTPPAAPPSCRSSPTACAATAVSPTPLVVDQGPEFHSNDAEGAFSYLRVDKVERPARKARFGAVMERMFGTTNIAFVHELLGNTTLLSLGRGLSSERHPARSAVWTLPVVEERCEQRLFEVYPALRPRDARQHAPRRVHPRPRP